jgi:hypothetical protein
MLIESALRRLVELETSMADLYDWYAETFEGDTEAAFVFARMTIEEKGHARLVEYQRRMVLKNPTLLPEVDMDMTGIEAVLAKARELRASPRVPTVEEALRETLRLEMSAAESYYRSTLRNVGPDMARILDALGGDDGQHVRRIVQLAWRRGVSIPAVGGS